jgi:nicotinamidase-related amidase
MQTRELVICGLATDICVQLTAGEAFLRDYQVWVPADCTAAESRQAKQASLEYMASVLNCDTRPSVAAPTRRKAVKKTTHG